MSEACIYCNCTCPLNDHLATLGRSEMVPMSELLHTRECKIAFTLLFIIVTQQDIVVSSADEN